MLTIFLVLIFLLKCLNAPKPRNIPEGQNVLIPSGPKVSCGEGVGAKFPYTLKLVINQNKKKNKGEISTENSV